MNGIQEKIERLRALVETGRDRFDKDGDLDQRYVTGIVVPALGDVFKDLTSQIEERHMLGDNEVAESNYVIHYTSITSLVSMLNRAADCDGKSSLRLYDSAHFNDPDEGNYFDRNLDLLKGNKLLATKSAPHAYIASFIVPDTEKDMSNNLVFWRTYGKEGRGCSLKLRVPSCHLRKVLYGRNHVRRTDQLLKSILDVIYDSLCPLMSIHVQPIAEVQEVLIRSVAGHVERLRYLYKSDAYDYERECRIAIPESEVDRDSICFEYEEQDNSAVRIRHYFEIHDLDVKDLLVTDSLITLGPCVPNPSNVRYYLETLLHKIGLYGTKVRVSKIPYRESA